MNPKSQGNLIFLKWVNYLLVGEISVIDHFCFFIFFISEYRKTYTGPKKENNKDEANADSL